MFALLLFVSVSQYLAKRLAEKEVSKMTYFMSGWTYNLAPAVLGLLRLPPASSKFANGA